MGGTRLGAASVSDTQVGALPEEAVKKDWVVKANEVLCGVDLGPAFVTLKAKWIALEGTCGYRLTRQTLITKPPSEGFKNLSSYETDVELKADSLYQVEQEFRSWWDTFQPTTWKDAPKSEPLPPITHNEWSPLKKHGKRGWISVLVYLKRWGTALQTSSDNQKVALMSSWTEAVGDVTRVMDGLLLCINATV